MKEQSTKGKKLNLQEIRVNMGLFDFDVLFAIGDYSKMQEYIKWKYEDKYFALENFDKGYECRGKCFYRVGYVPIIWIPRRPKTPREYATLAHECLHAIFHLFEWAGLPITRDTEEVVTHSQAHLINGLLEVVK